MAYGKLLTAEQRALVLLLKNEFNYSYRKIAMKTNMSKSSVLRVVKQGERRNEQIPKGQITKRKRGPRQLLTERDKRKLKRAIMTLREKNPNFTVMEVVQCSGVSVNAASYRTFLRHIKKMGYGYYQSRKKGVLTKKDFKRRRKFARSMVTKHEDFWTKHVAFYLDGVSFVYKTNPMSDALKAKNRLWRMRSEGLQLTTKGSKDLAGGRRLHFLVAIAYGEGVVCAEPYEKMSGPYFARFIRRHFPILFEIAKKADSDRKIFVMDNDPSQTSATARNALRSVGATMQQIPPRSPDLNPIENMFHIVRKRMEVEVKENNIIRETWDQFVNRVRLNIWSIPRQYIDKTIASMPKRIKEITQRKGGRTKY